MCFPAPLLRMVTLNLDRELRPAGSQTRRAKRMEKSTNIVLIMPFRGFVARVVVKSILKQTQCRVDLVILAGEEAACFCYVALDGGRDGGTHLIIAHFPEAFYGQQVTKTQRQSARERKPQSPVYLSPEAIPK